MSKSYVTNEMLFKAILLLHEEIMDIYGKCVPPEDEKMARDRLNERFYDNLGEDHGRRKEEI